MKFSSLKWLSLSRVLFTHEGVIEHLIAHCPLIEHLAVRHCSVYNHLSSEVPRVCRIYRVKSLFLCGLQKLKHVDVQGVQEVHVDSPNLENLIYRPSNDSAPLKLNFDSCTNLRCLCICLSKSIDIGDKWFLELFSKFPFLESLKLDNCSMSQSIHILSTQLKVLELSHCSNLKEANIYAQNLLSFIYRGIDQPAISFLRSSKQLEVKGYHCSLREFVQNIKPEKILASASLFIYQSFPIEPKQGALRVSSIPPSIKAVELLFTPENEALYFPYMSDLFSSCCPKSISFRLCSVADSKEFIEVHHYLQIFCMGPPIYNCTSIPAVSVFVFTLFHRFVLSNSVILQKHNSFSTRY
ncbi:hypothetical protein PIB30_012185 [Stylosanthes scabra]|uniref:At1g61320/AtMIF1 LRR domain-containing protein n=1 Tax=Stylosanthes scabra TaxID=79078 RepID=A0ABU6U5C7_9FABA|nr:hypothetical protein [Stylosanthes scabra]